jgi:hypothetical protein
MDDQRNLRRGKEVLTSMWAQLDYELDVIRATRVSMLRCAIAHIHFLFKEQNTKD